MTKDSTLKKLIGRTIVDIELPDDDYELHITLDDGQILEIGVFARFCDDAWLKYEVNDANTKRR